MVGTKVSLDPALDEPVHLVDSVDKALTLDPIGIYCRAELLCIDGIEWADIEAVRSGLIPAKRGFKSAFSSEPISAECGRGLDSIVPQVQALAERLYRGADLTEANKSFRPMITGPEPMHFDTFPERLPKMVAFLNVSTKPRVYRLSHSFPSLCKLYPDEMRRIYRDECKGNAEELSYQIRRATFDDKPPLRKTAPAHRIEFAPGSIWFFNSKTVSHEVVYGEGAVGFGWVVPESGALTQAQLIGALL